MPLGYPVSNIDPVRLLRDRDPDSDTVSSGPRRFGHLETSLVGPVWARAVPGLFSIFHFAVHPHFH